MIAYQICALLAVAQNQEVRDTERPCNLDKVLQHVAFAHLMQVREKGEKKRKRVMSTDIYLQMVIDEELLNYIPRQIRKMKNVAQKQAEVKKQSDLHRFSPISKLCNAHTRA